MRDSRLTLLTLLVAPSALCGAEIDYVRDVKPILAARCVSCHGAVRQKAGLRLDAASLIRQGGKSGPAVIPGKADESPLVDAVLGRARPRMPPPSEGTALPEKEVAVLKAWIDGGAKAPDEPVPPDPRSHWAFRPPQKALPMTRSDDGGNLVDDFLAAARVQRGVVPNPPANKATLLRRVTLDLTGLPPTPAELHVFLSDNSADAYEKVVDRMLASPQHGERWARHWMDVWRYSDPFGLGEEFRYSQRHIWRWRDWIVDSLNADKGYDRMIVEMLAGDEVAPADRDTLRATGYLARNWYKFNRNAWLFDTVEHTAAGFLGLTLRCARCHDHKYDPLNQQDYYRFRAFFEPHDIRVDAMPGQPDTTKDGVARAFDAKPNEPTYLFARGDERSPETSRALTPAVPSLLGGELKVEQVAFRGKDFLQALEPAADAARRQARAEIAATQEGLKRVEEALVAARRRVAAFTAGTPPKPEEPPDLLRDTFAKARPEVWKVASGNWAWEKGRLVLKAPSTFATLTTTARAYPTDLMGRVRYRTIGGGTTSVGFAFDVDGKAAWQAVYTHCKANSTVQAFHRVGGAEVYPPQGIVPHPFKLNEEITLDFAVRGSKLNVWANGQLKIVYTLPTPRQSGAFAVWGHDATAEFLEVRLHELPVSVPLADKTGEARPSPLAGPLVLTKADAEAAVVRAEAEVGKARQKRDGAEAGAAAVEARIAAERTRYADPPDPAASRLAQAAAEAEQKVGLKKGAPYTPLVAFNPATSTGRRLALARWIASRNNPLTARVAVNHVWMRHFGRPLVPTVANFGLAGKAPTHPELLDALAVEFMEGDWSFKKLHRLLVTSQTYRLSSADARPQPNDPDNVTLWRMNSRRLEAEAVRDAVLAAAGNLDATLGGPILDDKLGQISRRRSLYFRFNTEYRVGLLEPFDPASPSECYERRESVIPQQALALANSSLALTQARRLAGSLAALPEAGFVAAAFESVLGRAPTDEEQTRCLRFLREQASLLREPTKLTPFPPSPDNAAPPAADAALRAREGLVLVLFNHNDFVTVR